MWSDYVTTIASVVTAIVAIWVFFYSKRYQRFAIMEQSFDALQRINEKALESDKNVLAAIRSASRSDQTTVEEARLIYFQYMRINRIFRAYEYHRGGFLSTSQRERVIGPQLKTLVGGVENLPAMLQRGYPADFADFLLEQVKPVTPADNIDATGKGLPDDS